MGRQPVSCKGNLPRRGTVTIRMLKSFAHGPREFFKKPSEPQNKMALLTVSAISARIPCKKRDAILSSIHEAEPRHAQSYHHKKLS